MSFKVHIENFQSVRQADLEVDGLTIITGQNNAGKSAIMRALRAVFQNRRGSDFIHKGTDHCLVRIEFDDGQYVEWKKHGKRPTRGKNKGVLGGIKTDYEVNGERFEGVAHDVPEQVTALGVRAITLGNDSVWPQIARQVDDVFFLINRPGSNIAEAIADVERVAVLNHAIRACDKDARANRSKLKVRQDDVKLAEHRLGAFEGLDSVLEAVEGVTALHEKAAKAHKGLVWSTKMRERLTQASETVEKYAGITEVEVPTDLQEARQAAEELEVSRSLRRKLSNAREAVSRYEGFSEVEVPTDLQEIGKVVGELEVSQSLCRKLNNARKTLDAYEGFENIELPDDDAVGKVTKLVNALRLGTELRTRLVAAQETVASMDSTAIPNVDYDSHLKKLDKLVKGHRLALDLRKRLEAAHAQVDAMSAEEDVVSEELENALADLREFESEFPKCPECGQYKMEAHV